MTDLAKYTTKDELFSFLKANKEVLIAEKKFDLKRADALTISPTLNKPETSNKASISGDADKLELTLAINTTGIMDSHDDVHIAGLWDKSLRETKLLYLLREHKMAFDYIISDNVKASTQVYKWKDLGFNFDGETQALVFNAVIDNNRNPYMFNQYKSGYVLNHSVGMRYVKLFLAINDLRPDYAAEKDAWDKYFPMVANKDTVNEKGYFWAVTEAKLVEGSAVPMGSNPATPVININEPSKALITDTDSRESTINEEIKDIFKQILLKN